MFHPVPVVPKLITILPLVAKAKTLVVEPLEAKVGVVTVKSFKSKVPDVNVKLSAKPVDIVKLLNSLAVPVLLIVIRKGSVLPFVSIVCVEVEAKVVMSALPPVNEPPEAGIVKLP